MNYEMRVGALVKMNRGYSVPGLLVELIHRDRTWGPLNLDDPPAWARIVWPDDGPGIEKIRDLVVVG